MPCVDGREGEWKKEDEEKQRERDRRLDEATAVACELSYYLDSGQFSNLSPSAKLWITTHRENDKRIKCGYIPS